MTSLANQLRRLALPQTDQSLLMRKERASLLFDPKEAASLDGDFFHAIAGCTGLEELAGIEPAFDDFRDTLFSEASKRMERSVQSRDVNARLDESIALFLARLSPFFLLRPAHKCLEWLLYRFHIHQYNTEALIGCVLPYHETKVFVRVVQLLKISEPTHRWHWLHPLQKPGVPLSRSTLVMHCYKDLGFMDFICGLVTHAVQVFGEQPSAACQLRVLFSFYSSTLVAALEADRVTDTVVAKLLPHVQKGLRSGLTDYWASSLMLVAQLAVRATLEQSLAETLTLQLVRSLARRRRDAETRDGVACLIVLLQTQPSRTLKKKPFNCLCSLDGLLETLRELGATHDTAPLLRAFLPPLVSAALQPVLAPNDADDDCNIADFGLLRTILLKFFSADREHAFVSCYSDRYTPQEREEGGASDGLAVLHQRLLPILRTLEKRYTESWDQVMAAHLHGESAGTGKEAFHDFISLGAASGKHQLVPDSDTSLLLSLHHPQEAVRCLALSHLCTLV
uniref:HEAT repeat-containing protein 1 n=1 Tax=Petromyzon marinus TaxID=7757 RepID=S4RN64_PETMA